MWLDCGDGVRTESTQFELDEKRSLEQQQAVPLHPGDRILLDKARGLRHSPSLSVDITRHRL